MEWFDVTYGPIDNILTDRGYRRSKGQNGFLQITLFKIVVGVHTKLKFSLFNSLNNSDNDCGRRTDSFKDRQRS